MSKETREHLSALVDGEISRETSRFLVRRLGTDSELRATWTRYHLVRDCLRHQDGSIAGDDLCARINRELENEQEITSSPVPPSRWLKPVAGMAIAASVALMAVFAVGPGLPGGAQPATELAGGLAGDAQPESFVSPQSLVPAPHSNLASMGGPNVQDDKMNAYLVRHYQATGATGGRTFIALVPMVVTSSKIPVVDSGSREDENPESSKDVESGLK
jgi:sigma-E factor negative regulatory protein RseA